MPLYLSGNSCLNITYTVNQYARLNQNYKQSHDIEIKRIIRYLQGTTDKGLYLQPENNSKLDYYMDTDVAGLWGKEYDQDLVYAKLRMWYIIIFMGCPIFWSFKLQNQIIMSTMDAEYICLSQSIRDLTGAREVFKEIFKHVFDKSDDIKIQILSKDFKEIT